MEDDTEGEIAKLSPMHMIRKRAFGFPRCGLLAYHATETPQEALSEIKSSLAAAGHPLSQVDIAQFSLVHYSALVGERSVVKSISVSLSVSVCLSVCLSVYLSVCLSVCT